MTSLRQAVLRELANNPPLSQQELRTALESSPFLWWWERMLVRRQLYKTLRALMREGSVQYLRHESRRKTDKARFKYSLTIIEDDDVFLIASERPPR